MLRRSRSSRPPRGLRRSARGRRACCPRCRRCDPRHSLCRRRRSGQYHFSQDALWWSCLRRPGTILWPQFGGARWPRSVSTTSPRSFPSGVVAVDDVTLEIAEGEFIVLVGPSGCGKSTLLRMIAGLEEVTDGLDLDRRPGRDRPRPRHRDIAMVFQSYALYPHMTVRQNLGYGLKVRRTPKREIRRRVEEVAALLGLEEMLDRRPAQLSGGQRQRVAMGRAIVREPKAFLMDEPLSNLDAKLRVGMRASLAQLHARLGVTTVYVTHDQVEAMTLGQRVAVVRDGRILQVDSPHAVPAARATCSSRLHRLAGDEPRRGDDRRRGVSSVSTASRSAPERRPPRARTGRARHPPRGFEDAAFAGRPADDGRRRRRRRGRRRRRVRLLPGRRRANHRGVARGRARTTRRSWPRRRRSSPRGSTRGRRRRRRPRWRSPSIPPASTSSTPRPGASPRSTQSAAAVAKSGLDHYARRWRCAR